MPYSGVKAKDSAIAAIIKNFIAFRLIFILPLCTAGVSQSVRCHTYWFWGQRGNLAEQAIVLGSDNLVAFADTSF